LDEWDHDVERSQCRLWCCAYGCNRLRFGGDGDCGLQAQQEEKLVKHEYHEGPEAAQRFEKLASHLFRAPKSTVKSEVKPVPKRKKTSKG
jgi:hypothetical protein